MRDASTYPVTFPYGATTPPYGPGSAIGPYHRGDDRIMPVGTPVVVNGTQLGLSGMSGAVTGPHLHIGKFINGQDVNPQGKGFALSNPAVVDSIGYDSLNGNYVRVRDSGGTIWVYLHLSQVSVGKGKVLGDSMNDAERQDYNKWKAIGQALSYLPTYKAMGGTPGNPDANPQLVQSVVKDLEDNKLANIDAQKFKKKITDSPYWGGSLDALDVVQKGGSSDAQTKLNQIKAIIG